MANFNSTTPAAPGSAQNIVFAYSGANVSAYSPVMVGDTGSGGKTGAVPAPGSGDTAAGKYLKADGSWAVPAAPSGTALVGSSNTFTASNSFTGTATSFTVRVAIGSSSAPAAPLDVTGNVYVHGGSLFIDTIQGYTASTVSMNFGTVFKVAGLAAGIVSKSAAYTLLASDFTVLGSASSAAFTLTLPAAPVTGSVVNLKKVDSSANAITIAGNGKNIDGASSKSLTTQYQSLRLQYDGSAWWVL